MPFQAENESLTVVDAVLGLYQLAHRPSDATRLKIYVSGVRKTLNLHFILNDQNVQFLPGYIPPVDEPLPIADYPWDVAVPVLTPAQASTPPAGLAQITDHVARAVGSLIEQYRDKPRVIGLLSAFVKQVQGIEDGIWGIFAARQISTAVGQQLDVLGRVVGEPRNGRTDVSYRTAIQARVLLNLSSGTVEEIYAIFTLLLAVNNLSPRMQVAEFYPKAFVLRLLTAAVPDAVAVDLADILMRAKDAGAKAFLEYGNTTPFFGFDGSTGSGFDAGYFGGSI